MAAVDWPKAPTDIDGANGVEASSADGGSRCCGRPARRPRHRGAHERVDEQQQLDVVARRPRCRRHSARSSFVAYYGRCVGALLPPQPVNPSFGYF
ncbi:hypothetical protein Scep_002256 [Stephania cephalantha]|uniref:Uncharacterized protein n=1 Tax=Stephania cephalantha TaxID=152367 RepID=A0AAP0Q4H2_9MAGN